MCHYTYIYISSVCCCSEYVYVLYLVSEIQGEIINSMDYLAFTAAELSGISSISSPRGGDYMLYDLTGRSLLDYRSAFSILVTTPILSVDQTLILANIQAQWKTLKPDISATISVRVRV